jgi:arylformamidase
LLAARLGLPTASDDDEDDAVPAGARFVPPAGTSVERDLPYGDAPEQRMDVYRPASPGHGGVIVLVHGGGWRRGDKADARLVANKVTHWVGQGWVLVSVNYRLLPDAGPLAQADDVARALAAVQRLAPSWGADPTRCVLMGHSAGAHLVALLTADAALARARAAAPWRATVAIDTAAYDLVALMGAPHLGLYDLAFGADPQSWRAASPWHRLQDAPTMPVLLVCSARRATASAPAQAFASRIESLGGRARVLPVDLGHFEINRQLGLDPAYTRAVDDFLAGVRAGNSPADPAGRAV